MLVSNGVPHNLKTCCHTIYMVLEGFVVLKRFTLVYPYNACNQWRAALGSFPAYLEKRRDGIGSMY
jgi:hypothetical protein